MTRASAMVAAMLAALALSGTLHGAAQDADAPSAPEAQPAQDAPAMALAEAGPDEQAALNALSNSKAWTSRAIAVMRLERFDCPQSAQRLLSFAGDPSWRVRAYAFACAARRGVVVPADMLDAERDPRVLRAMLRCRLPLARASVDARVAGLEKSAQPLEAMLALEILCALDAASDKDMRERLDELLSRIVLRMDRTEGGVLSPRLATVTAGSDSGRNYRWREWLRKNKKDPGYRAGFLVPAAPAGERQVDANRIAQLDGARFAALEKYLASVAERPMDLAILIDCTASMSRELADAQSGVDDLVEFLGSVTKGVRVAVVGYRDRGDEWETKGWDFTADVSEARTRLWSLSADGGGDTPESVHAAMKLALARFTWLPDARSEGSQPIRACVLVGDAPPHAGEAALCIDMARRAAERGVNTFGIVARDAESNLKE
ncbi:MAG: vWA domain-containing protein [Planctomycetota bacterium]